MKQLLFFAILLILPNYIFNNNDRPIIGVWTQPTEGFSADGEFETGYSYIAACYVNFIEQSGARVIPIRYDWNRTQLSYIFKRINGLVFPGGGASLTEGEQNNKKFSTFMQNAQFIINLAVESNKNGQYFPVWGTCLGFEIIVLSFSNNPYLLDRFNDENTEHQLQLINQNKSKVFENISNEIINHVQQNNVTYFSHHFGIKPLTFYTQQNLNSVFDITALSQTNYSQTFVAAFEGKNMPIYANQFHPEKPSYIWRKEIHVDHQAETIKFSQFLSNFFINQCKINNNHFENNEEESYLIKNFQAHLATRTFEQVYYFRNQNLTDQNFEDSK